MRTSMSSWTAVRAAVFACVQKLTGGAGRSTGTIASGSKSQPLSRGPGKGVIRRMRRLRRACYPPQRRHRSPARMEGSAYSQQQSRAVSPSSLGIFAFAIGTLSGAPPHDLRPARDVGAVIGEAALWGLRLSPYPSHPPPFLRLIESELYDQNADERAEGRGSEAATHPPSFPALPS